MCVLFILNKKECYGYELVNKVSKYINISEGTVYPILKRLALEQFLQSYIRESSEGPPRKYYKITDAGYQRLKELYSEWNEFSNSVNVVIMKEGM